MISHQRKVRWQIWALALIVLAVAGTWVAQAIMATPEQSTESEKDISTIEITASDSIPTILSTSDAYDSYVRAKTTGPIRIVAEKDVFKPETIDWQTQEVAVVSLSLLSAKSILSAQRETVDGVESFVISILDAPNCMTTQDNTQRLIFVAQTSGKGTAPVILKTAPNTATCEDIQ
jgi:cytoskeletal protein RodZ